ncbi:Protein of unknown function [Roseibium denhamense]|uniref:DUF1194 domain-containing protein n=1 Tax=Roseibium denhamense TaxID=76305 RepID=A0ABY1NW81_9HYPH|nr:Protein of unknown function [Roseibium denhamense]
MPDGQSRPICYPLWMHPLQILRCLVCSVFSVLAAVLPTLAEEHVDVALVLAVDVSRSMSQEELDLQRRGYAAAISSPDVVRAIEIGARGRIAMTMFEWANDSHVREIVGWHVLADAEDANAFAAKVLADTSYGQRRTSISGAIRHGTALLSNLPFLADRRVIDISGDGPNNQGAIVTAARDAALKTGITINGLPLMTKGGFGAQFNIDDLDEYYRRCVIGGPASFVVPVNGWEQFPEAVRRKLILEIGGIRPAEPAKVMQAQFNFEKPYDCEIGEKIWRKLRRQFFLDP